MIDKQILRQVYLVTLYSIAFFLPLSVWLLTFFIIVMTVVWIAQGGLKKIGELKYSKRSVLVFCGIYFVYLVWMIWSSDMSFGLRELRLKLPLLIFPVVIGLSDPPDIKETKRILVFFVAGVVVSSLAGFILYVTKSSIFDIADTRKMSPFISNLTLAEMTDFALVISVWYLLSGSTKKSKYFFFAAALWLTLFLFLLLSLTGIVIFFLLLLISVIAVFRRSASMIMKSILIISVSMFLIAVGIYISGEIKSFYTKGNAYSFPLKNRTPGGNDYTHYPERKDLENGNQVWIYICEKELRKEWNLRSNFRYDSTDLRNQQLRFTLIRYLTSASLTKDSSGVAALRDNDISYIENGISNRLFTEGRHIKSRLYEIIWQLDFYKNGGNPSGHSLSQRIEYYKKGWHLLKNNWLFGTGTGDIKNEFKQQFRKENALLDQIYVYLPHNQYLTFLISFGILGFIIICGSVFIPVYRMKSFRVMLFNIFFVIILVSMVAEDSLETHPGVSFFAYFYSIFVLSGERNNLNQL
jgi:hypothetical protein